MVFLLYFHYKLALNLVFKDLKTTHIYKHLKSTYNSLKRRINTLERKGLKIDLDQQQQVLNLYKLYSWTITAKQNFINDYNSLPITDICKKYNITQKTAEEYNRNFTRDILQEI